MLTPEQKIISNRTTLAEVINQQRELSKRIVFTNGCFDILHRGHVANLCQAKSLGDFLVIGVNTDESVRSYKGENRPINAIYDRLFVLASLQCVDLVAPFEERKPIELIKIVKPDIYVKGGDYAIERLSETRVVESLGGRVEIMPFVEGKSTTNIIEKIVNSYAH